MKINSSFLRIAAAPLAILPFAFSTAHAARELFSAEVVAQDGSGLRQSVSSSNFIGLVSDVVKAEQSFAVFQNRPGFATLNYADVPNAVTFQQNQAGTQAVLQIPLTGLQKTFTGNNRADVERQIVDFLKKDGQNEYEKFLAALNKRSKVSPIDGNPNAATARMASATFGEFAFPTGENQKGNLRGASIMGTVGRFTSGQFKGDAYQLPLSFTLRATDKTSVVLNIPLSYMKVEGSEVFNAGLGLSVPMRFRQATSIGEASPADGKTAKGSGSSPERWTWQVTPTVGGIASAAPDFGTVGLIGQVALTNMLSYNFDHFTIAMGNHVSWLESIPFSAGGYSVSSGVSQFLFINGLQVSVPLGDRWLASAYGVYTRFLEAAAVQDYFTLGAEIGFKILPNSPSYLKLGFYSDIGSDYSSANIRFGTGWKF